MVDPREASEVIRAVNKGKPMLYRCCIGLGIHVAGEQNGYALIEVNPHTDLKPEWTAKREFMETVVREWSATLAKVRDA